MRAVGRYDHSPDCFLKFIRRTEQRFFLFHDLEDLLVITGNSSQIDRDHRFRLLGNRVFQGVVIHLITVLRCIYQYKLRSHMADRTCRRRIGICRSDHFIPLADP